MIFKYLIVYAREKPSVIITCSISRSHGRAQAATKINCFTVNSLFFVSWAQENLNLAIPHLLLFADDFATLTCRSYRLAHKITFWFSQVILFPVARPLIDSLPIKSQQHFVLFCCTDTVVCLGCQLYAGILNDQHLSSFYYLFSSGTEIV